MPSCVHPFVCLIDCSASGIGFVKEIDLLITDIVCRVRYETSLKGVQFGRTQFGEFFANYGSINRLQRPAVTAIQQLAGGRQLITFAAGKDAIFGGGGLARSTVLFIVAASMG